MSEPTSKPEPLAAHVFYSGHVQGVGFRATVAWMARTYPVTGWVQNLADGRVELHAEGTREAVEAFLNAISIRFANQIRDESIDWQPASGRYTSFGVNR